MAESVRAGPSVFRFGTFDLDARAGELSKAGVRTRLQDHPLEVLLLLLERPGDVVTREELRARLWPHGTVVDFAHGVNTAVKRLREALGDDADDPTFIETIPRRGYRFIAPVEAVEPGPVREALMSPIRLAAAPASGSDARDRHERVLATPTPGQPLPLAEEGRYRVGAKIDEGNMGAVYRARDARLERDVAVKVLPSWLAAEPLALYRFQREAHAAAALNHPNLLAVYDLTEIDGSPCIVSELLQGQTLRAILKAGALPLDKVFDYACQLLEGLVAAHEKGIVHRDFKPENVMVTPEGRVKILDFGLARLAPAAEASDQAPTTTVTDRGRLLGTPAYMSPEQAEGVQADHRSDIFAFGIVLYEMVAGERPFKGVSTTSIISAILKDTPRPLSEVNPATPAALARLVRRCLQKTPQLRYQSTRDLRNELAEIREEWKAGGFEVPQPAPRRPRHSRLVFAGVLGLAVVLVVVGVTRGGAVWRAIRGGAADLAGPAGVGLILGAPVPVTSAPGWEHQPALSPDGSLIAYSSNERGNQDIFLVTSSGGPPIQLTSDAAADEEPTWFRDGTRLAFASNRMGRWNIWKMSGLGGGAELLVPDARDPALSPDETRIAFTRPDVAGDSRVMVAPLSDVAKAVRLTKSGDTAWEAEEDPAWSPDSRFICYSSNRTLWLVPSSGGQSRKLLAEPTFDIEPAWLDNRTILFSSLRDGTSALWWVSIDGGMAKRLTLGAGPERHPSFSRDRSRLAFASYQEDTDLVNHDVKTGREFVASNRGEEGLPTYSTDGRKICFVRSGSRAVVSELWLQEVGQDGTFVGQPHRLLDQPSAVSCPSFNPDGKWIAYQRLYEGRRHLWMIPESGSGGPIQLTAGPGDDFQPSFAPTGRAIAFVSTRGGTGPAETWTLPVADHGATGPPVRVASGPGNHRTPVWSPDGQSIAYVSEGPDFCDVWLIKSDGVGAPRRVASGRRIWCLRWRGRELALSGAFGQGDASIRLLDVGTGSTRPFEPPIDVGLALLPFFDIRPDGRVITFSRGANSGDLFVADVRLAR